MSNWRDPKITPKKYVQKRTAIITQYTELQKMFERRLRTLDTIYAKAYSPKKAGETIEVPEGAKPGYDLFTVVTPIPRIRKDADGNSIEVYFDYYGKFSGADVEDKFGTLKIGKDDTGA